MMTSREPLPLCLVALCLGVVVDKTWSVSPMLWATLFLFLVFGWLIVFRSLGSRLQPTLPQSSQKIAIEKRRLFVSTLLLSALIGVVGGLWHHLYWNVYPANDPGLFRLEQPTPVVLEGCVITSPRWLPAPPDIPGRLMPPSDHTILTLRVTQLRNGLQWEPATGRISVSMVGKLPDVYYGDQLRLVGKLSPPNPPQNPGDYDQSATQRQQRVLAILRVDDAGSVTKLKSGGFSIGRQLERLRLSAKANITQYMKPEHASFASAMILGVRDEINPELSQMLLESGVSHIIAISGLHVGLVALGFVILLRIMGLRRKAFAIVLALMILCYLCITDMRPSAIRATLLVFVACISIFRGQRRLQINAFAATGIVVLAINPSSLFQIGTQLSFLATSVFLWFNQNFDVFGWFGKWFDPNKLHGISTEEDKELAIDEITAREMLLIERQWFRMIWGSVFRFCRNMINGLFGTLLISTVIWLVVTPLIASQMHLFSPVAILINPLLWVPLMLALLSGFGVMIAGWFCPPLAALFGVFADWSYAFLTNMIAWFHAMPAGYFWVPGFRNWWLIGFYTPFVIMGLFPQLRPKKFRWLFITVICWLLVAFAAYYIRQWDDWRNDRMTVRVLSVGHGLCVHIKTPDGRSILYDVGSLSSPYKSANIAANSLWDVGHRKIGAVIISHPDSDHYNGLSLLLEKFPAETVYVTPYMFRKEGIAITSTHEAITSRDIPIITIGAGDTIEQPGFPAMRFLHPPISDTSQLSDESDSNANSLVLLIEHRGHRVLLPGDVESERTLEFLREPPVHVDLMLSPHHGSIKKTADELVAWASPDYVVISGGLFTYNPESKTHFEQSGCTVFETLKSGMVEFVIDRNGTHMRLGR